MKGCKPTNNRKSTKNSTIKILITSIVAVALTMQANATIFQLDIQGTAGFGLLPGNEPGSVTGGTGGEIGSGITYDDITNLLDLTNVGWGSSQGFTDLTSSVTNSHLHGSTANANGNGFTQTAGVLVNLTRSSNAVSSGVFTNPLVDLDTFFGVNAETKEAELLAGKWYINIHTSNNGGGEMRGFLTVPEPTSIGLLGLGTCVLGLIRRRK